MTTNTQPPPYNWSSRLTKSMGCHETMGVGSCCLFNILAHVNTQCFKYTSYLCVLCNNAICITGHTVAIDILSLHLKQ
jgi:hypothetical protein